MESKIKALMLKMLKFSSRKFSYIQHWRDTQTTKNIDESPQTFAYRIQELVK